MVMDESEARNIMSFSGGERAGEPAWNPLQPHPPLLLCSGDCHKLRAVKTGFLRISIINLDNFFSLRILMQTCFIDKTSSTGRKFRYRYRYSISSLIGMGTYGSSYGTSLGNLMQVIAVPVLFTSRSDQEPYPHYLLNRHCLRATSVPLSDPLYPLFFLPPISGYVIILQEPVAVHLSWRCRADWS